jgi:hypothetical protein
MLNCMSCYRPVGFEYFTLNPTIDGMLHPLFTEQGGYLCMECVKIIRNGGVVDGDGLRVNRAKTTRNAASVIHADPESWSRRDELG